MHRARAAAGLLCALLLPPSARAQAGPALERVPALGVRAVTVADMIRSTVVGDPEVFHGEWSGHPAEFSPDERRVAIVVRHGDLERNAVESSILVFRTDRLLGQPMADTVVTFTSSSNRPAIAQVRWLADNVTLVFLGEQPNELPQVYAMNLATRQLTKRTAQPTVITSFAVTPHGDLLAYTAETADSGVASELERRRGYVIAADHALDAMIHKRRHSGPLATRLFIQRPSSGVPQEIADSSVGPCVDKYGLTLDPTGRLATQICAVRQIPKRWLDYTDDRITRQYIADSSVGLVFQRIVVDVQRGRTHPLMDAPLPIAGLLDPAVWMPDGRSIVVGNVYLPLSVADPTERQRRMASMALAEVDVESGVVTPIVQGGDSLQIVGWDRASGTLVVARGRLGTVTGPAFGFRKVGGRWQRVAVRDGQTSNESRPVGGGIMIALEQGLNAPPQVVATDLQRGRRMVVVDPNPQFKALRLGRVDAIRWQARDGRMWTGGLYYPPDFAAGTRYPLVVQTHGFDSTAFSLYGSYTTAFAAQALAGRGMLVLQTPDLPLALEETANEAPTAAANLESAIDLLDSLGLIDRARVGLIGFSRTCWYVKYMLTHSKHQVAAAAVADGIDAGYVQYMLGPDWTKSSYDRLLGAAPFGPALDVWRRESPGFNLDKVATPLRIDAISPNSVIWEWEWYAGLQRLGKPVEMNYIPDGVHELVKPWERLSSAQGNVDWFSFWLKGEEDPDPAKAEQYARWRDLRRLQQQDTTERQQRSN